jgi:glycosyltransferase involved in cell wall biosynthesis
MTSETYAPRIGGAEIHIQNVISHLNRRGFSVCLITNEPSNVPDHQDSLSHVIRIPWKKKNVIKILSELWTRSKDVDVIHAHYAHRLAALAGIVGFIRRKPVVVILHGMGILNPASKKIKVRLYHSLYRKLSLIFASKVISTSQDLADFAYRYTSKTKVLVIPNGFDSSVFNISNNSEIDRASKKIVLTVRRLVPKNGIQFLVEAMPKILESRKDVVFFIVGDGPLESFLKQRVDELGVAKNVSFEGFKSSPEVAMHLREASVVVFPSTAESASLACAEAMAMKKKIVASKVGGLIELLGSSEERGILVKLVDWEHSNYNAPLTLPSEAISRLAEAVLFSLSVNELNDIRAERGYEYAIKVLSWESIIDRTIDVYKSLQS